MVPPLKASSQDDLLDLPLSASRVRSFELSASESDSESDSEADGDIGQIPTPGRVLSSDKKQKKKDKKHKKEGKRRKRKPRLINLPSRVSKTAYTKAAKEKDWSSILQKKDGGKREKVLKAVAEYIEEKGDSWTSSLMREEISEKYGWDNNNEFTTSVKIALGSLGISGSGGNRVAAE